MALLTTLLLSSYKRCGGLLGDASCRCGCRTTGGCFTGNRCGHTTALLGRLVTVLGNASGTRRSLCVLNVDCCGRGSCRATTRAFVRCCGICPHNAFARLTHFRTNGTLCLSAPRPHLSRSNACDTVRRLRVFVRCFPRDSGGRRTRGVVFTLRSGLMVGRCLSTGLCCGVNGCLNGGCRTYIVATRGTLGSCPCAGLHRSLSVLVLHTGCRLTICDIRSEETRHCHRTISRYCTFGGRFPRDGCAGRTSQVFGRSRGVLNRKNRRRRWLVVYGWCCEWVCKLRGSGYSCGCNSP